MIARIRSWKLELQRDREQIGLGPDAFAQSIAIDWVWSPLGEGRRYIFRSRRFSNRYWLLAVGLQGALMYSSRFKEISLSSASLSLVRLICSICWDIKSSGWQRSRCSYQWLLTASFNPASNFRFSESAPHRCSNHSNLKRGSITRAV